MAHKLAYFAALGMVAGASAFQAPLASRVTTPSLAAKCGLSKAGIVPMRSRLSPRLRMSTEAEPAATDEYFGIDAEGNKVKLTTSAKEKKYLDACNAFYNDKTKIMNDAEFDKLREDLSFEGSTVATMNRMEVMFMVAANRWAEGNPIMSDEEFDDLRRKLKGRNSPAVRHKVPTCRIETSSCKADLVSDDVKNAALYIPVVSAVSVVWLELAYLVSGGGFGPVFDIVLNSPFIAVFSYVIKNFVLFQNPLVVRTSCPQCYTEQNIYFGDILWVSGKDADELKTQCVNQACGCELRAYRKRMVVESDLPKEPAPKAAAPAAVA